MTKEKPLVFSGMQATGVPSLGNYVGAIKHWAQIQDEYRCLYCVVDLHSLTVRQEPAFLRKRARELFALFIALGVDPKRSTLYFQSHVPAHAELAWILNCYTYVGELNRMTQFKDKSRKHADNINAGLYDYPVLMAADILLFQTDAVPVGEDQKQHIELCRDVAERFNGLYGPVFKIPAPLVADVGARIMSLQEPGKKMSKSETENMNNVIFLLDEPDAIMKKFKRAVTDSENEIRYAPEAKPGVSNLLEIYAALTNKKPAEAENDFKGMGYGALKTTVGETVVNTLKPVQEKFRALLADEDHLDSVIASGADKAQRMAWETLWRVKRAVGLPEWIENAPKTDWMEIPYR